MIGNVQARTTHIPIASTHLPSYTPVLNQVYRTIFGDSVTHTLSSPPSSNQAKTKNNQPKNNKKLQHTKTLNQHKKRKEPLPTHYLIHNVPIINQLPQLKNGCEVTSLAMMLNYNHIYVTKMTLAEKIKKDPTLLMGPIWDIEKWGNPNVGFVGNIYHDPGYGVYHHPLMLLARQYVGKRAVDLTKKPFSLIEHYIANNDPVLMITMYNFVPWHTMWQTYTDEYGHKVTINLQEHAVVVVGYDMNNLYVNNPLTGQSDEIVNKTKFLEAWEQFGQQAITIIKK
jgi:uncharacterized protein YvpB